MCEGRGGEPSQACTCIDVRCCTHTLPGASTHPAPSPTHAPTSQCHTLDPFYRVHTRRLRRSTSSWSCWSARTRGAACGSTQSGASVSATAVCLPLLRAVPASAVCCGASVGATAVCLPLLCAVRHLPGHECVAQCAPPTKAPLVHAHCLCFTKAPPKPPLMLPRLPPLLPVLCAPLLTCTHTFTHACKHARAPTRPRRPTPPRSVRRLL